MGGTNVSRVITMARWVLAAGLFLAMALIAVPLFTDWRVVSIADPALRILAHAGLDVLERRFARAQVEDWSGVVGVIVLGGQPDRFWEAFQLASAHPHLRVIVSGASAYELGLIAEAPERIRRRIEFERQSLGRYKNTYGNAVFCREMIDPSPKARWLLITSAAHIPRAIGAFHRVGFAVEPWPIYDRTNDLDTQLYVVRHEWLGLIAYRLMGWTDQILPASPERAPL
jgi:uncharacterized SAM-binding protein YcdF (DUF218 family)